MSADLNRLPWIIFKLKNQYFAMDSAQVSGIIQLPQLTSVPEAPPAFEGVANIRGDIIPILSMRTLLQMPTVKEENKQTIEYFTAMRKRVEAWLNDFKRSVIIGAETKYDDNPLKCNFGQWLSDYKSDNLDIIETKAEIVEVFNDMAYLAKKTRSYVDETGLREEGMEVIARLESDCKDVDDKIQEILTILSTGGVGIAITLSETQGDTSACLGVIVDSVHSVDSITLVDKNTGHNTLYASHYVMGIAHCNRVEGEIIVIDELKVLEQAETFSESQKNK